MAVVEKGGFTGAAGQLGISKSAVSKHIAALEARLGARLLDRTTRRVHPTEIGLSYFERAQAVLAEAADADDMVTSMQSTPRGVLKISAPVTFGLKFAGKAATEFLKTYEDVSIDMSLSDRFVDLISEGYDLALRIADLPDSTLRARQIAQTKIVLMASPAYLEKHGRPETIDDLNHHELLHYSRTGKLWRIVSKSGEERHVRAGARMSSNNGDVLMQAALDGIGIASLPSFFLSDELKTGALEIVLPEMPQPSVGVHLVYPPGRYTQPKTRAYIDFMVEYFKDKGPMDW